MTASSMPAVRWHARGDVRIDEVPVPTPGPGQVLIAVEACGICGTDLEEVRSGPIDVPVVRPHPLTGAMAPITLGHEVLGTVAAAGPGTRARLGQRVIPDVVLGCGACWWCQRHQQGICEQRAVRGMHTDGGLASYMIADADTLVAVPAELATEVAVLAEPVSVAVRAIRKAGDLAGARAIVLGLGTVGNLLVRVLRRYGVAVTGLEPDPGRRLLAQDAGTDVAASASDLQPGADVVFECSGAAGAAEAALAVLRPGGLLVMVGIAHQPISIDPATLVVAEQRIAGSAAHLWDEDVTVAVRLLADGLVDQERFPTQSLALADIAGVLVGEQPAGAVLKTIARPPLAG
ncbi:MAG: alcohol dehydrogenase catalytic domain-containing protein [Beutenbergiaceae bacterium]